MKKQEYLKRRNVLRCSLVFAILMISCAQRGANDPDENQVSPAPLAEESIPLEDSSSTAGLQFIDNEFQLQNPCRLADGVLGIVSTPDGFQFDGNIVEWKDHLIKDPEDDATGPMELSWYGVGHQNGNLVFAVSGKNLKAGIVFNFISISNNGEAGILHEHYRIKVSQNNIWFQLGSGEWTPIQKGISQIDMKWDSDGSLELMIGKGAPIREAFSYPIWGVRISGDGNGEQMEDFTGFAFYPSFQDPQNRSVKIQKCLYGTEKIWEFYEIMPTSLPDSGGLLIGLARESIGKIYDVFADYNTPISQFSFEISEKEMIDNRLASLDGFPLRIGSSLAHDPIRIDANRSIVEEFREKIIRNLLKIIRPQSGEFLTSFATKILTIDIGKKDLGLNFCYRSMLFFC